MEKKNETLNILFAVLGSLFNSANTFDAFYLHYANAKSIFNDLLKQIEEKPTVAKQIFEKQGEKQDYNPYKTTIESIAAMVEKYANGDLKDFYDNIKVKCKDAMEYDNTWNKKQGEQNPAWSEEDEKIIETMCKEGDLRPSQKIWLKSLKDRVQPHWKPTDEQMNCFKQAIDLFKTKVNDDLVLQNLNSLYNDLKKL